MTAICKTINIHGGLSKLLDYGSDQEKTSLKNNDLQNALDYAKNPLKTILELDDGDNSMLVTGIQCTPETAEEEFGFLREKYREHCGSEFLSPFVYQDKKTGKARIVQKEPVTAIHLIQSFAEPDLDPRTVHQIGIDLCERMGWQAVVDTHMNTGHFHNHIIINAYCMDGRHKVSMDKDTLLKVRQLSDDIQQEYGIDVRFLSPEKQLEKSSRTPGFREWYMQKRSLSWKDRLRMDMLAAAHVSTNREDFISIMESYGYTIERQTEKSILWWNNTHTRKIWDRTLGKEFRLDRILDLYGMPDIQRETPVEPSSYIPIDANAAHMSSRRKRSDEGSSLPPTEKSHEAQDPKTLSHYTRFISTARYDWDGRRRSDLELLFRKAISIIQHIKSFYTDTPYDNLYNAPVKLERMSQAISTAQELNIDTEDTLRKELHNTGAALSHVKSELKFHNYQKEYYDNLLTLISEYEEAQQIYSSVLHWNAKDISLHLNKYSTREIQENRAAVSSITPAQKRELYLAMKKHPEYQLRNVQKGYANISSIDTARVLRFFSGKCEKPEILIDTESANLLAIEKYYYPDAPPDDNTEYNMKQVSKFHNAISTETVKKQTILLQLRNRKNALLKLGYNIENLDSIREEISEFYNLYESLSEERHILSEKYKSLIRLSQLISFAESDPYLYGSLLAKDIERNKDTHTPDKKPTKDHIYQNTITLPNQQPELSPSDTPELGENMTI